MTTYNGCKLSENGVRAERAASDATRERTDLHRRYSITIHDLALRLQFDRSGYRSSFSEEARDHEAKVRTDSAVIHIHTVLEPLEAILRGSKSRHANQYYVLTSYLAEGEP